MAGSYSPSVASEHVLYVSASTLIDAPIERVWAVLVDLPAYKEWNTFMRSIAVTDREKNVLENQTLAEGKNIHITINTALTLSEPGVLDGGSAFAVVSTFDPDNYRVAWKADSLPSYFLDTERWQRLSLDETTGKTKYETHEFFDGLLAYYVKFVVGRKIAKGFQAAADALKERVEGMK